MHFSGVSVAHANDLFWGVAQYRAPSSTRVLFSRNIVSFRCYLSVPPIRSISIAKRNLLRNLPLILNALAKCCRFSSKMFSRKRSKIVSDRIRI